MRALLTVAILAASGFSAQPQFEVASVRPSTIGDENGAILFRPGGRFTATAIPLKTLVSVAYKVRLTDIYGAPRWIADGTYDIIAKAPGDATRSRMELMLRSLLEQRFQLKAHRETRELSVFALEVAKNGPKLKETADSECFAFKPDSPRPSTDVPYCGWISGLPDSLRAVKMDMKHLAEDLSVLPPFAGRPIIDRTGLTGSYDIQLKWAPDDPDAGASGPSIFTALREQLGLRLEPEKAPMEVFVIDHIERLREN